MIIEVILILLYNVIGSNIAIFLFCATSKGFQNRLYRFEKTLFGVFLYFDSDLNFLEGFCFVLILCLLTIYLIRYSQNNDNLTFDKNIQQISLGKMLLYIILGSACLYIGSRWFVYGASGIARSLGISERIISVFIHLFFQ